MTETAFEGTLSSPRRDGSQYAFGNDSALLPQLVSRPTYLGQLFDASHDGFEGVKGMVMVFGIN